MAGYICRGCLAYHGEDCLHLGPGSIHFELQAGSLYKRQVCGVPDASRRQRVLQLYHAIPPAVMEHVHWSRYLPFHHWELYVIISVTEFIFQVFTCHPSKNKHTIIFTEPEWTRHWWFFPSLRTSSWKTDRKHDAGHLRIHPSHVLPPQTHADTHIAHFSLTCPITHYGCYRVTCHIFAEHIWHISQSVATSYTFICEIFLNHNAEQFLGFWIKKSLFIVSRTYV